jgi:hypothetical protein
LGDPARHSYGFEDPFGARAESSSAEHCTPPRLQHHSLFTSDQSVLISSSFPTQQSKGMKTVVVVRVVVPVVDVVVVAVIVLVLVAVDVVVGVHVVVVVEVGVIVEVVVVVEVCVVVQATFSWSQHHDCFAALHAVRHA